MNEQRRVSIGEPLRTICALLTAALGATSCGGEGSRHGPGFGLTVAPLTLPGVSYVCYDVEVRGPGGVVVLLGDPGRSYLDGDAGTICSWQYGNNGGGDISYVAPCDADDGDGQSPAEADNTVTIWFDGLYRDADGDHDPAEDVDIGGWQDPCPDGCSLPVLCRENSDTAVTFDFTVMREAHQGFFDIGVDFEDIFCSAKLDCVDALLHDTSGERGPTVVVAFACTAGVGAPTWLHTSDLVLTCDDADPLTPPIVQTLTAAVATPGQHGAQAPGVFQWATYEGDEQLTSNNEPLQKCYYNRAVGLATSALVGKSCHLTATATATDVPSLGQVLASATTYPIIEWDVEVLSATGELCGNNALDADGSGVTSRYLAAAPAQPPLPLTATIACGGSSLRASTLTTSVVPPLDAQGWSPVPVSLTLTSMGQGARAPVAIGYRIDDGPEVVVPGDTLNLDFATAGVYRVIAWEIAADGIRSDAIQTQIRWQPTFPDLAIGPFQSLLGLVVRSAVKQASSLDAGVTYNQSTEQGQLLQAIGDLLWAARFYDLGDADKNGEADREQLIKLAMGELGQLEAAAYRTTTAGPAFGIDAGGDAWAWQTGSVAVGVASLARVLAFHKRTELAQTLAFGQALVGAWDKYFTEIGPSQGFFWATTDGAQYAKMAVHHPSALMANASMILAELGGSAEFVAWARDRSRRYANYLAAHIEVDADKAAFWMDADDESGYPRSCIEESKDAAGRIWTAGVDPCHLWSAAWPGGARTLHPEDVSHLGADADFIRNALEYGIWENGDISTQLSRTLTERTWSGNPARPYGYIDGRYSWPYTGKEPPSRDPTIDWERAIGASLGYAHLGNIAGGDPQLFEMARAMLFSGVLSRYGVGSDATGTTTVFGLHPAVQLLANRPPDFALGSQWKRVAGPQDTVFEASGGIRFDPEQSTELRNFPNTQSDGAPASPWDLIARIDPKDGERREVRFLVDLPKGPSGRVSLSLTWWGGPAEVEIWSDTLIGKRPAVGFVPLASLPETIDGFKKDAAEKRWWRTTFVVPEDAFYDALPDLAGTTLRLRVRGASGALLAVHLLEATVLMPTLPMRADVTRPEVDIVAEVAVGPFITAMAADGMVFDTPEVRAGVRVQEVNSAQIVFATPTESYPWSRPASFPFLTQGQRLYDLILPEGQHTLTANAIDAAGNVGSDAATIFVDLTPPIVTSDVDPLISHCDPENIEPWPWIVKITDLTAGSVVVSTGSTLGRKAFGVQEIITQLEPGLNTVTVTVTDGAGHQTVRVQTFFVDDTPPDGYCCDASDSAPSPIDDNSGCTTATYAELDWESAQGSNGSWQMLPSTAPVLSAPAIQITLPAGQDNRRQVLLSEAIPYRRGEVITTSAWATISGDVTFSADLIGYADVNGTHSSVAPSSARTRLAKGLNRIESQEFISLKTESGDADGRWHFGARRESYFPDYVKAVRIVLTLTPGPLNNVGGSAYVVGVRISKDEERLMTLDADFNRERRYPGSESDYFLHNLDWSRAPLEPADSSAVANGILEIEGPNTVTSSVWPYGGEALRFDGLGRLTDAGSTAQGEVLVELDAMDGPEGTVLETHTLAAGAATDDWVHYARTFPPVTSSSPLALPDTATHVRLRLVGPTSGLVEWERVALDSVRSMPPPVPDYNSDHCNVTIDAGSTGSSYENPVSGIGIHYATALLNDNDPSIISTSGMAVRRLAALRDGPPTQMVRLFGVYLSDKQDGEEIADATSPTRFDSVKARLDFLRLQGFGPFVIDVGSPPFSMADEPVPLTPDPDRPGKTKTLFFNENPLRYEYEVREKYQHLNRDFAKWLLDTYPPEDVLDWYFLVHNEPDAKGYFAGTFDDYLVMFDFAAAGLAEGAKEWADANPDFTTPVVLRIGGPALTSEIRNRGWVEPFLRHCSSEPNYMNGTIGESGLSFFDWHAYAGAGAPALDSVVAMVPYLRAAAERQGYTEDTLELTASELNLDTGEFSEWLSTPGANWTDDPRGYKDTSQAAAFTVRAALEMAEEGLSRLWFHVLLGKAKPIGPGPTTPALWDDFLKDMGVITRSGITKPVLNGIRLLAAIPEGATALATAATAEPLKAWAYRDDDRTVYLLLTSYEDGNVESLFYELWDEPVNGVWQYDFSRIKSKHYETTTTIEIRGLDPGMYNVDRLRVDPTTANGLTAFCEAYGNIKYVDNDPEWKVCDAYSEARGDNDPRYMSIDALSPVDGEPALAWIQAQTELVAEALVPPNLDVNVMGDVASFTLPIRNHSVNLIRIRPANTPVDSNKVFDCRPPVVNSPDGNVALTPPDVVDLFFGPEVTGPRNDGQLVLAPFPSGQSTIVTWTATDSAGHEATCEQTIVVP